MAARGRSEIETELKVSLSPQDLEKVFRALVKEAGKPEIFHKYLPRAYYDTEELDLYNNRLSLRVQYKPGANGRLGSHEQTVKMELPPDVPLDEGVLLRKECKDVLPSHLPDLGAVTDDQAAQALAPFKGMKLAHIFTAAIERRFFEMDVQNGKNRGRVEVAFDVGRIVLTSDGTHQDFYEIEIEIKRGSPKLIQAVRERIFRLAPSAKIQPFSKAVQGSLLYLQQRRKPTP